MKHIQSYFTLFCTSYLQTQFITLPSDSSLGILRTLITMFCIIKLAGPLWFKDFLINACIISPINLLPLIWTFTIYITSLLDWTTAAFQSSSAKHPQLRVLQVYSDFGYSCTELSTEHFQIGHSPCFLNNSRQLSQTLNLSMQMFSLRVVEI